MEDIRPAESRVVTYSRGSSRIREALPAHQFSHYRKACEPEKSLESYEKKRGRIRAMTMISAVQWE